MNPAQPRLTFQLEEFVLDEAPPPYVALSYRWGDATKSLELLVNDQILSVGRNLWHFLNQIHIESDDRWFWTDAICINQEDVPERNAQVAQMAEIYSGATLVISWLGHSEYLRECLKLSDRSYVDIVLSDESLVYRDITNSRALDQITGLEYWDRAWVYQELTLSSNLILKCLDTEIRFETFLEACDPILLFLSTSHLPAIRNTQSSFLQESPKRSPVVYQVPPDREVTDPKSDSCEKACSPKQRVSLLRRIAFVRSRSGNDIGSLFTDLMSLVYHKCTDPRDKCFSLLGLHRLRGHVSDTPYLEMPQADYGKSLIWTVWRCGMWLVCDLVFRGSLLDVGPFEAQRQVGSIVGWMRDLIGQPGTMECLLPLFTLASCQKNNHRIEILSRLVAASIWAINLYMDHDRCGYRTDLEFPWRSANESKKAWQALRGASGAIGQSEFEDIWVKVGQNFQQIVLCHSRYDIAPHVRWCCSECSFEIASISSVKEILSPYDDENSRPICTYCIQLLRQLRYALEEEIVLLYLRDHEILPSFSTTASCFSVITDWEKREKMYMRLGPDLDCFTAHNEHMFGQITRRNGFLKMIKKFDLQHHACLQVKMSDELRSVLTKNSDSEKHFMDRLAGPWVFWRVHDHELADWNQETAKRLQEIFERLDVADQVTEDGGKNRAKLKAALQLLHSEFEKLKCSLLVELQES